MADHLACAGAGSGTGVYEGPTVPTSEPPSDPTTSIFPSSTLIDPAPRHALCPKSPLFVHFHVRSFLTPEERTPITLVCRHLSQITRRLRNTLHLDLKSMRNTGFLDDVVRPATKRLRTLTVHHKFEKPRHGRRLMKVLSGCSSLTQLELDHCGLAEQAVPGLKAVLANNTTSLTSLNLQGATIPAAPFRTEVLPAIGGLVRLKSLNLTFSALGGPGGLVLAEQLTGLRSLERLNVSWCKLDSEAVTAIVAATATSCPKLSELSMGHNAVHSHPPDDLQEAMQQLALATRGRPKPLTVSISTSWGGPVDPLDIPDGCSLVIKL